MKITKRIARERLKVNDAGLAAFFDVTAGAVSQWRDDDPLPELRHTQLMLRRADLFPPAEFGEGEQPKAA